MCQRQTKNQLKKDSTTGYRSVKKQWMDQLERSSTIGYRTIRNDQLDTNSAKGLVNVIDRGRISWRGAVQIHINVHEIKGQLPGIVQKDIKVQKGLESVRKDQLQRNSTKGLESVGHRKRISSGSRNVGENHRKSDPKQEKS